MENESSLPACPQLLDLGQGGEEGGCLRKVSSGWVLNRKGRRRKNFQGQGKSLIDESQKEKCLHGHMLRKPIHLPLFLLPSLG